MKAILIDPVREQVTEVEYNGDYRHIYELLTDDENELDCCTFDVIRIDDREAIFVDDEGLLKMPRYFFKYEGYGQPLAGRGLVLGNDDEGETIATKLTADAVRARVAFTQLSVQGFKHIEGKVDHPLLGPNTPFVGSKPIFGPPDKEG